MESDKDVFIGIVPAMGSMTPSWHGAFSFDEIEGYTGKLLSSKFEVNKIDALSELPDDLTKEQLLCVVDGAKYATALFPRFLESRINNFSSQILRTNIPILIEGVHLDEKERCISRIALQSPLIALLFGMKAYNEKIETTPEFKVTIEYSDQKNFEYKSKFGKYVFGISRSTNHTADSCDPQFTSISTLSIYLDQPISAIEAMAFVQKVEQCLSLLCFDFIKMSHVHLGVDIEIDGIKERRMCDVKRGLKIKKAKLKAEWFSLPIRLEELPVGEILDTFIETYDNFKTTLDWYRIVVAENAYVENKFFYCVRMFESLYKSFDIPLEKDSSALEMVDKLTTLAKTSGTKEIEDFISKRVSPMFKNRPGFYSIVLDLKERYSDIISTLSLDEKKLSKLRGKEAHGNAEGFSHDEYQVMLQSHKVLLLLYKLFVLEKCGVEKDFLLASLRKSPAYSALFSQT